MCAASWAGSRELTREAWPQSLHCWGPCPKCKFMWQLHPQCRASLLLWAGHTGSRVLREAWPRASPQGLHPIPPLLSGRPWAPSALSPRGSP